MVFAMDAWLFRLFWYCGLRLIPIFILSVRLIGFVLFEVKFVFEQGQIGLNSFFNAFLKKRIDTEC